MIRALASFGVRSYLPTSVTEVLSLADDFRRELCAIYQERHERTIDLRNKYHPELFDKLVECERNYAKIWEIEKEIKALHADVRDRNAVEDEQRETLEALREERKKLLADLKELRKGWAATLKAFSVFWGGICDWKNVKSLEKRKEAYTKVVFPTRSAEFDTIAEARGKVLASGANPVAVQAYGRMWMELDLRERDLGEKYQTLGLHSAIRGEIVDASVPKLKDGQPGMRYTYGRKPEPEPWEKITCAVSGGISVDGLLAGTQALSAKVNGRVWRVRQQIGTVKVPRVIEYAVKVHRDFPEGCRVNRWSLVVRKEKVLHVSKYGFTARDRVRLRATVVPIISMPDAAKPMGTGTFAYDLSWTVRKDGVQVCRFLGDNVNETLVIPNWLVDKRMSMKDSQRECDLRSNKLLADRGCEPQQGSRQGFEALQDYAVDHPDDNAVANLTDECTLTIGRARRETRRAIRCVKNLYRVVAFRVCSAHAAIIKDDIDLAKLKRYDTRDLLRKDVLPARSREIMHAVAPGKLRALLDSYGLSDASGEVPSNDNATDLFSSFVGGLRRSQAKHEVSAAS